LVRIGGARKKTDRCDGWAALMIAVAVLLWNTGLSKAVDVPLNDDKPGKYLGVSGTGCYNLIVEFVSPQKIAISQN
jgi:hypothetical protein